MTTHAHTAFSRRGRACAEALNTCPNTTFSSIDDTAVVVTASDADHTRPFESRNCSSYADIRSAIDAGRSRDSKSIIVSLSSWGSYDPLRITKEDLQQLFIDEDIDASFGSAVAAFGELPRVSEQGFGCCSTNVEGDGSYSASYLLRFAQQDGAGNWKVRQIGVYQRYLKDKDTHFWILVQSHPPNKDAFSRRLGNAFGSSEGRAVFNASPFCLHELLLDTYMQAWRWFMHDLGRKYRKQSSNVSTARTNSELAFGLTLQTLQDYETLLEDIIALPAIFDASLDIISSLEDIEHRVGVQNSYERISIHQPIVKDLKRSSEVLMRQAQGIVNLLGNTLDLKNQEVAAKVNSHLLNLTLRTTKDSATIRVVTLVTLFYLPATSVAALFGMNFFNFDVHTRRLELSDDLWIYAVLFVPLTGVTIFLWWLWIRISVKRGEHDPSYELKEINP